MLFYATCITGLQEPVSRLVQARHGKIVQQMDGALLFEADRPVFLPCFNNIFETLFWEKAGVSAPLERLMRKIAAAPGDAPFLKRLRFPAQKSTDTFRIVTSAENKLVSVDRPVKTRIEELISARTGLKADRGGSGHEFWFLYRREGYAYFLKRLTTHTAYEKILRKGELRPELAYLLQVLANPEPDDIVLDPFSGYGAIPLARLHHFPCAALYASDIDAEKVAATQAALALPSGAAAEPRPHVEIWQADIELLAARLPQGSVNKIVTDPPWGLYETIDIRRLYEQMMKNFLHVLKPGGIIVVLTTQKELLRELLSCPEADALRLVSAYDTLVSGKKAGVFVMKRGEGSYAADCLAGHHQTI